VAPPNIQQDLLAAKAVGEKAYEAGFRVERLESQPPQTKFHDNPGLCHGTFTDLNRKVQNVHRDHPES